MLRPVLADEENGDTAKARPTPTSNDYATALREPGTTSGAEDVGSDARADVRATETDASPAPTKHEVSPPNELEAGPSSGVGQGVGNVSTGAGGASGSGVASSADAPSASSAHQGGGEAHPAPEVVAGDAITFPPMSSAACTRSQRPFSRASSLCCGDDKHGQRCRRPGIRRRRGHY